MIQTTKDKVDSFSWEAGSCHVLTKTHGIQRGFKNLARSLLMVMLILFHQVPRVFASPTSAPTAFPTYYPTSSSLPSTSPSTTSVPSSSPTSSPTSPPTKTSLPSTSPSTIPSSSPTSSPTSPPTKTSLPSTSPSTTSAPSTTPSLSPSSTSVPSSFPSTTPSLSPSSIISPPSAAPFFNPSPIGQKVIADVDLSTSLYDMLRMDNAVTKKWQDVTAAQVKNYWSKNSKSFKVTNLEVTTDVLDQETKERKLKTTRSLHPKKTQVMVSFNCHTVIDVPSGVVGHPTAEEICTEPFSTDALRLDYISSLKGASDHFDYVLYVSQPEVIQILPRPPSNKKSKNTKSSPKNTKSPPKNTKSPPKAAAENPPKAAAKNPTETSKPVNNVKKVHAGSPIKIIPTKQPVKMDPKAAPVNNSNFFKEALDRERKKTTEVGNKKAAKKL